MKKGVRIWLIGAALVFAIAMAWAIFAASQPSKLAPLAACLKEKGAIFYGAFWCPHCQATKRMFGSAATDLPYVECSTPDKRDQLQVCKDKNVTNYPTWDFADDSRLTGELTAAQLSKASGCPLPL
jgi:thiol-disulfide isomerase/thioredoxin